MLTSLGPPSAMNSSAERSRRSPQGRRQPKSHYVRNGTYKPKDLVNPLGFGLCGG